MKICAVVDKLPHKGKLQLNIGGKSIKIPPSRGTALKQLAKIFVFHNIGLSFRALSFFGESGIIIPESDLCNVGEFLTKRRPKPPTDITAPP